MPRGASPKREREYREIVDKTKKEGRYKGREEEVAARIVNKQRREAGETKSQRGGGRGGDTGMIRLDFPGFSGAESLQEIDWDEWFRAFDENDLGLLVQETTASGERSNFNKLVNRDTAGASR